MTEENNAPGNPPEEEAIKEPSRNQPRLDRMVEIIREHAGADAMEAAVINERDRDIPMVTIRARDLPEVARILKEHPELQLNYLRNVSGVDYESHMEVVYHLISTEYKLDYHFKVKADHEKPALPSVTSIWSTANWQEREIYDLLGIDFTGHPDQRRIMMPDDWVGHPLRKDYVPIDPEV